MSKVFDEIREEKAIRIAKNLIKMGKSTLQEIPAACQDTFASFPEYPEKRMMY